MADEFWNKIYDKLIDNFELLKLICFDTANQELLSWVNPNHELKIRCNRYLRFGVIADKNGLINEILSYAKSNNPLRRIILLTWVNKNQKSMDFFSQPGNEASIEKLKNGEYGNIHKVRILSYIDPRQGSAKLYKDILEEADKKEKEEKVNEFTKSEAEQISISNAEIEAALHSKDIIASPDTNNGTYSGNFNEVVYEELEKIKAALEVLKDVNKQLKSENKELRKEQNKRKTEITNFSTKLESKVIENKKLNTELEKEKDLNSSLTSQLKFAKEELASKPVPTISESEINDLRFKLDEALKENDRLKKSLSNKEASLNRIKTENEELSSKAKGFNDQSNLVKSLQQKLADTKSKSDINKQLVVGQIVTKTKFTKEFGEKAGKKCWLFVSITGQVYYLDLNEVPKNYSVPEEYLLVGFEANKLVSVQSLETERKEVLGNIKLEDDKGVFVSDEETMPIYIDITDKWVGRPARGIWLPELDDRSAGIYKIDILPDTAKLNKTQPKSSKKSSEKDKNKTEKQEKFNGQKVIVFGGDRVGLEYEKALNNAGLSAKWFSGFSLLTEISLGFGKPDLMIIVTKQISHALLRELNAYAEKYSIPVAYSTRRGITSVLEIVDKYLCKNIPSATK